MKCDINGETVIVLLACPMPAAEQLQCVLHSVKMVHQNGKQPQFFVDGRKPLPPLPSPFVTAPKMWFV